MALPFQNVLIYEDEYAQSRRFMPLAYTRSVAELRTGAFTGIERVQRLYPEAKVFLHSRPELAQVITHRYDLPVNVAPDGNTLRLAAGDVISDKATVASEMVSGFTESYTRKIETGASINGKPEICSLWDAIARNASVLAHDWKFLAHSNFDRLQPALLPFVAIENAEALLIHSSAKIGAGIVFDCSEGPIIIDEGARIMPHSTIIGPVYIGKHSLIKAGAKIYGGTTIGPVCKIGGEVENSIFQGYSNKQHDGYVGHSFIGEWCNLGAGTNTSDLKNDYSPVRVTIEGDTFDTGSLFVGLMMGDHSKSSIGMQFNTGTAVGVSCNIFDAGFPPKWIPNFSWGGANGLTTYRYEKAIEVARAVMIRRGVTMTKEEESSLRRLFVERTSVEV